MKVTIGNFLLRRLQEVASSTSLVFRATTTSN